MLCPAGFYQNRSGQSGCPPCSGTETHACDTLCTFHPPLQSRAP
jgi:hypothetical protein